MTIKFKKYSRVFVAVCLHMPHASYTWNNAECKQVTCGSVTNCGLAYDKDTRQKSEAAKIRAPLPPPCRGRVRV